MSSFSRKFALVLAISGLALSSSACGVRQFNSDKHASALAPNQTPKGHLSAIFGPFHAAGQHGEAMVATTCGSKTGRPCTRARASVGLPYQFDTNSNTLMGPVAATGFAPPPSPYTAQAGPGKTAVASGPRVPAGAPRVENRDLHLMQKQANPGEDTF